MAQSGGQKSQVNPVDFEEALKRVREVAARITVSNQNSDQQQAAGGYPGGNDPRSAPTRMGVMNNPRMDNIVMEDIQLPVNSAVIFSGRCGDVIARIQKETGVNMIMGPEPHMGSGNNYRAVTLSGTPESVHAAKSLIHRICSEGRLPDMMMSTGSKDHEEIMMVPAGRAGLIIGKNGETIRSLQERSGCRIFLVQDGPYANSPSKPLKISGDSQNCQRAKQMVFELLSEKDGNVGNGNGGSSAEIPVPKDIVGFIIGKSGETIRKIQQESGAHVQFLQDGPDGPEKLCIIQGNPNQVQAAQDIINNMMSQHRSKGTAYRGPPVGSSGIQQVEFPVVANRAGLVIGKGGENIRNISQVSGAHVEIVKNIPESSFHKYFCIIGTEQQIRAAQMLIREKVGEEFCGTISGASSNQGALPSNPVMYPSATQPGWVPAYSSASVAPDQYSLAALYYQNYYQLYPAARPVGGSSGPQTSLSGAPQLVCYPHTQQLVGGEGYSAAAATSASWAPYYQQYYGQYNQNALQQQQQQQQQQGSSAYQRPNTSS